jgi:hypothetical protein
MELIEIMELRDYAEAKSVVENPDIDEEKLARLDIPERLVERVMDNIKRKSAKT